MTEWSMRSTNTKKRMKDLLVSRVTYSALKSKEKESYNFAKVTGFLADYGFECSAVNSDGHGADMIAYHYLSGKLFAIQLKGRPGVYRKYQGKNLWMAFIDREKNTLCLYPHDQAVEQFEQSSSADTSSWIDKGEYTYTRSGKTPFEALIVRIPA